MRVLSLGDDIPLEDLPDLSERSSAATHQVIERWIVREISKHRFVVGDRLPSESQLAEALGVSRMTLRQGLSSLEARGILRRKRGRQGGTFIAEPKLDCDLTGLVGFTEQMRRANVRAGARIIDARTVPAPRRVGAHLELPPDAEVHEVVRVRTANRQPVALEKSYLPAMVFPDLLRHRLTGSLYGLIARSYGQVPHIATEWLEAVTAEDAEARLLGVSVGSPLMLIERVASTAAGLPIECAFDLYRPDRTRVMVRAGIGETADERRAPAIDAGNGSTQEVPAEGIRVATRRNS